jgi:hypothetical protein
VNPDRRFHGTETALTILTFVVVFMAFGLVVLALVDAYRP